MSNLRVAQEDLRRALRDNALKDYLDTQDDRPKTERQKFYSLRNALNSPVDHNVGGWYWISEEDLRSCLSRYLKKAHLKVRNVKQEYYLLRRALHRCMIENTWKDENNQPKDFSFSTRATPAELQALFDRRMQCFHDLGFLSVPAIRADGSSINVPVSLDYPEKTDDHSYHTVKFVRHSDGAIAELLVRQADNYTVAFKVYINESMKDKTPWCVFSDVNIPETPGGPKHEKLNYSSAHDNLRSIKFSVFTLDKIFKLLFSLQKNPQQLQTPARKRLLVILFLILGEAQRFRILQQFFIKNVENETEVELDRRISNLFNIWNQLCMMGYEQYIAQLDKPMFDAFVNALKQKAKREAGEEEVEEAAEGKHADRNPYTSLVERTTKMIEKAVELEGILDFSCLIGEEILLLNCETTLCLDIMMRMCGYTGILYNKKQSEEGDPFLELLEEDDTRVEESVQAAEENESAAVLLDLETEGYRDEEGEEPKLETEDDSRDEESVLAAEENVVAQKSESSKSLKRKQKRIAKDKTRLGIGRRKEECEEDYSEEDSSDHSVMIPSAQSDEDSLSLEVAKAVVKRSRRGTSIEAQVQVEVVEAVIKRRRRRKDGSGKVAEGRTAIVAQAEVVESVGKKSGSRKKLSEEVAQGSTAIVAQAQVVKSAGKKSGRGKKHSEEVAEGSTAVVAQAEVVESGGKTNGRRKKGRVEVAEGSTAFQVQVESGGGESADGLRKRKH